MTFNLILLGKFPFEKTKLDTIQYVLEDCSDLSTANGEPNVTNEKGKIVNIAATLTIRSRTTDVKPTALSSV